MQLRIWVLVDEGLQFLKKLCCRVSEEVQGMKLAFLARSHLAPKFSKVVAKAKKLGAVKKKKKIVKKMHYTVVSNGRVFLALNLHEQTSSFAPIHLL